MRPLALALALACTALAASPAAAAGDLTLIGEYEAWRAYRTESGGAPTCFAATMPVERAPEGLRRGDGFLFVTARQGERSGDELSLVLGYPLQAEAPSRLVVGSASFGLMEKGEAAWLERVEDHAPAIGALRQGLDATVETISARGNETRDAYSLRGFTRAYEAMTKACR